jgi:tetratricopeptide (TPR) repeat protein
MRVRWLAVGAIGLAGCFSSRTARLPEPPAAAVSDPTPPPLRAAVVPAAATAPEPPAAPAEPPDALTLAAECLGRGDEAAACVHLEAHVRTHPDQVMFRAQLAELLYRLGRLDAARRHYDKFVADAQDATGPANAHRVHAHTRLMEIGQRADDRFAELLHRGVGLLLLLDDRAAADSAEEGFGEEVLVKALAALAEAKDLRPTDARVYVYLADAHDRAGNRRAADVARAAARTYHIPGSLTPHELRQLSAR